MPTHPPTNTRRRPQREVARRRDVDIVLCHLPSQKAGVGSNHRRSGSNHRAIVCPKPQSGLFCRRPCWGKKKADIIKKPLGGEAHRGFSAGTIYPRWPCSACFQVVSHNFQGNRLDFFPPGTPLVRCVCVCVWSIKRSRFQREVQKVRQGHREFFTGQ